MFQTAWTFGHFRGVPLRLHISLILVLPLIALAVTVTWIILSGGAPWS